MIKRTIKPVRRGALGHPGQSDHCGAGTRDSIWCWLVDCHEPVPPGRICEKESAPAGADSFQTTLYSSPLRRPPGQP
jgi:hypothetical protein